MAIAENQPIQTEDTSFIGKIINNLVFPTDSEGIPKPPIALGTIIVIVASVALGLYRWYMEANSFTVGLDYFEPEFQVYWMSWLYGQAIVIGLVLAIGAPLVWFTRPTKETVLAMDPTKELGIYTLIFTVMAMASFMGICVLGLWVEADAAWHQVTIRDTDFTPTHIQLFYGLIPMAAVGAIVGLLWLHLNMPDYSGRVSVPLVILAAAPLLIMPNLGYNEWGHTFFYAEELFAAPVHWGFVVLGWGLFAISGFLLECMNRVLVLTSIKKETKEAAA
ncbi:MAG: methane monooxygenase/ammonia monooxygenase subunit C [Gammaproteobacteria bacterium]|nr:methane monooxygenase/ammonia monooxygenase subunit C [Gammaproteobacteria bacterium]